MDVLISWSKSQSRGLASVFHDWLPTVLPGLKPWMSSKDIDKGKLWFSELQEFLEQATSCIVCVTSENVRSPWIYYEMGAIAAKPHDVLVCPYLMSIGVSMVADGPLAQFQCTEATKDDTLSLIRSMNRALAAPHHEGLICGNFESKWPEFEQELNQILEVAAPDPADFLESEADVLAGYKLSAEARTLIVTAAQTDGTVLHTRTSAGCNTQAGRQVLNEPHDRRSEAMWEQAIQDLVGCGLLNERGHKGEVFQVSAKGYEIADLLEKKSSQVGQLAPSDSETDDRAQLSAGEITVLRIITNHQGSVMWRDLVNESKLNQIEAQHCVDRLTTIKFISTSHILDAAGGTRLSLTTRGREYVVECELLQREQS